MKKRILSIFTCTLLIFGIVFFVPGTLSDNITKNDTSCCGMQGDCTTLISDNNQIIEVNESGGVVWDYILGTVDSERLPNGNTLLGGSVLVKEIDFLGFVKWQYGTGLLVVSDVERLENNNTLITDFGNNFVREVDSDYAIVWEITGLSLPMDAERLSNGNTLIVNNLNGKVVEVNSSGGIVWEYDTGIGIGPTDAERLSNGNTLITEQLNNRVIEVDSSGTLVWEKTGLQAPKDAERLSNGNTLIVEYDGNSIIEVDNAGTVVWSYFGSINNPNDVERVPNQIPNKPTITGPANGIINIPYPYIILGNDPGGHIIYYWVDWGDGDNTGWLGPYISGTPTIPLIHTWTTQGTFAVKAKIKDICDVESPWGELEVSMPKEKTVNKPFIQYLQNHPNLFPLMQLLLQRLVL
jgi:hypothetical protein